MMSFVGEGFVRERRREERRETKGGNILLLTMGCTLISIISSTFPIFCPFQGTCN